MIIYRTIGRKFHERSKVYRYMLKRVQREIDNES